MVTLAQKLTALAALRAAKKEGKDVLALLGPLEADVNTDVEELRKERIRKSEEEMGLEGTRT